jgi:hypothetical protein
VTAAQISRLVGLGSARWVDRRLSRRAVDAQAELGLRLFERGLGDTELRNRLVQLDDCVADSERSRASTRKSDVERRGLLIRLAAPYCNRPPPAGLEREHSRALAALAAGQEAHRRASQEQARLLPADNAQRRRLATGVAVLAVGALVAGWLVVDWFRDDRHPSILIGEWMGKTEWVITFTTRFEFARDGRVFWHQDFGAIAPAIEGTGTWRVQSAAGTRYTLEVVDALRPDETWGWVIVFNGDDEFTITGYDDMPITVHRQK